MHVFDQWRHLGTARCETDVAELMESRHETKSGGFDLDIYRLLLSRLSGAKGPPPDLIRRR